MLFEPDEIGRPLPRSDPRALHLLQVLRRSEGGRFDAGVVDGPRGRGTVVTVGPDTLILSFAWGAEPPPLAPITLIIGLPRPQTARDILRDATSLGVAAMHFVATDKGEPSYARSVLWSSGEWRRQLLAGAAQAFDTRLPAVTHGRSLLEVIGALPGDGTRLALDNYEAGSALGRCHLLNDIPAGASPPVVFAIGSERGWSTAERSVLRGSGFTLVDLGARVLRTETAVVAAVAVLLARPGAA
jgi:16S rRNA (uracil1498-N3)-methyltransferase